MDQALGTVAPVLRPEASEPPAWLCHSESKSQEGRGPRNALIDEGTVVQDLFDSIESETLTAVGALWIEGKPSEAFFKSSILMKFSSSLLACCRFKGLGCLRQIWVQTVWGPLACSRISGFLEQGGRAPATYLERFVLHLGYARSISSFLHAGSAMVK